MQRGTGACSLPLVLALLAGCNGEPAAPSPLFDRIVHVADVATAGGRLYVANDVATAIDAPPGVFDPDRLHDLVIAERSGDAMVTVGSLDLPAEPLRRTARRIALHPGGGLAFLALGDGPADGAVAIVDVSDVAAPELVGTIEVGRPVVALAAAGALLAFATPEGVELADVTDPGAPVRRGAFPPAENAGVADLLAEPGRVYAAGTAGDAAQARLLPRLLVLDVSDPDAPSLLGEHRMATSFQALGVALAKRGDRVHLLADIGLDVVDVSDPAFPVPLGGIPASALPFPLLFTDLAVVGNAVLISTRSSGLRALDLALPEAPLAITTYPETSAVGSVATAVAAGGGDAHVGLSRAGVRVLRVDADGDLVLDAADVCPDDADPQQSDGDGDGAGDACDVCLEAHDPLQTDADGDGFGNACDADLDGNGVVNFVDLAAMKLAFFGTDPVADLTGDGVVNFGDLQVMKGAFFGPPGPSARAPAP